MEDLNWQGNTKAMFDKMVQTSPLPIRPITKKSLLSALKELGGDVTEEAMYEVVKKVTPKPFVARAIKELDSLKS